MGDLQTIVEEIRRLLLSSEPPRRARVEELAREYAAVCVEINERLAACQRLLRLGLRSEAIHASKFEPNLIDAIQILDFPSQPQWMELMSLHGLPLPQPLDMDAAALLQSAYVEEDPLQELLKKHRRLALGRAPVRQRIAVLRSLAELDRGNPIWVDDLAVFEPARIEQIRREANEAARRQDMEGVRALVEELSSNEWRMPPQSLLTSDLMKKLSRLAIDRSRKELSDTESELRDAFLAQAVERGFSIRERWQKQLERCELPSEDALRDRAQPALQWLQKIEEREEEDREFSESIVLFERALDEGASRAELDQLRENVLQFGRVLTEPLNEKLLLRLKALDRADRRRRRFIAIGVSVGALASAAVIVGLVRHEGRVRVAERSASAIRQALDDKELQEARRIRDEITRDDPGLLELDELTGALTRLKGAEKDDEARVSQFSEALRDGAAVPLGRELAPALIRAKSLARTTREQQAVDQLQIQRQRDLEETVHRNDAALTPKLQSVLDRLGEIRLPPGREPAETSEVRKVLAGILADKPVLSTNGELYSDELRALDAKVRGLIQSFEGELTAGSRLERLAENVTHSLMEMPGSSKSFVAALEEMTKDAQLSRHARSGDFRKVLEESRGWAGALKWAQLLAAWRPNPLAVGPEDARERLTVCRALQTEYPQHPDLDTIKELTAYFSAIGDRNELWKNVSALLSDVLIDKLYLIESRGVDGVLRYYTRAPFDKKSPRVEYLVGFDGKTTRNRTLFPHKVSCDKSPQTKLAEGLRKELAEDPELMHWEEIMLAFVRRVAEDQKLDALAKRFFLLESLRLASRGGPALHSALEGTLRRLEASRVPENAVWPDPDDKPANMARPEAEALVKSLPGWDKVGETFRASRGRLLARLAAAPQPVGWLARDAKWMCPLKGPLLGSGVLLMLAPGTTHYVWVPVGKLEKGQITLTENPSSAFVEGRLVFLVPAGAAPAATAHETSPSP
jgi:hypothetical protein